MTKIMITETLISVIFKTIMVPLHRERFAVVHSTFSIVPQNFPGANLYQKLPVLAVLGAASPQLSSHNGEILHEGADLGLHPQANLKKNSFRW